MFTIRPNIRRVFWKKLDTDTAPIGEELRLDENDNSIQRTFEIFFLTHFSLYAKREEIRDKVSQLSMTLSKKDKKHLLSIVQFGKDGTIEAWQQDGFQRTQTNALFEKLRSHPIVQGLLAH